MNDKNLERIADALEKLASVLSGELDTVKDALVPPTPPTPPVPPASPEVPTPPGLYYKHEEETGEKLTYIEESKSFHATLANTLANAHSPITTSGQITLKELNEALKIEFVRLNSDRTIIDNIIKKYGAATLSDLDVSKYNDVLKDVKEYKV